MLSGLDGFSPFSGKLKRSQSTCHNSSAATALERSLVKNEIAVDPTACCCGVVAFFVFEQARREV